MPRLRRIHTRDRTRPGLESGRTGACDVGLVKAKRRWRRCRGRSFGPGWSERTPCARSLSLPAAPPSFDRRPFDRPRSDRSRRFSLAIDCHFRIIDRPPRTVAGRLDGTDLAWKSRRWGEETAPTGSASRRRRDPGGGRRRSDAGRRKVIVCSCNALSDRAVRRLRDGGPGCGGRVADVFVRAGCTPQCGRCATTIRGILREAPVEEPVWALAAE